ncbi:MAG: uroporphyrinogen-III synthase [Acidobacteria bacterium]|nr:uroporphyrinogen-III synthase [Acidobacteriota bacterium]
MQGLRVLSLESRRQVEIAKLIESHGGIAVSAPSMREIPVEDNPEALTFAERLLENRFDAVIFLTGVGTRILFGAMESRYPRAAFVAALSRTLVVARGPKPVAVLREYEVAIAIAVPEPNTWRDILKAFDDHAPPINLRGKMVAVQEYGAPNREFLEALRGRGAQLMPVPVYQWALPADLKPLRQAAREIAQGRIDVLLVTSATQVDHLMRVAAEEELTEKVRTGLVRAVVCSIGPISTQALESHGIAADFEPSHPKMGQLVFEAAQKAGALLARKRGDSRSKASASS